MRERRERDMRADEKPSVPIFRSDEEEMESGRATTRRTT